MLGNANSEFKRKQRGKFVLKKCLTDERTKEQIRKIPLDSPTENMEHVLQGLEEGRFTQADVFFEGQRIGWTVFEVVEEGREFLSICSFGTGAQDNTCGVIPMLEEIALEMGCQSIRLHTVRPGLIQKLLNQNWFTSEVIMRKILK